MEALRLDPPIPLSTLHITTSECKLDNGELLPKDTRFILNFFCNINISGHLSSYPYELTLCHVYDRTKFQHFVFDRISVNEQTYSLHAFEVLLKRCFILLLCKDVHD